MEIYEREYVSVAVNFFWGQGTVSAHTVNDKVAAIAYKAIQEAQSCSASIDLVPRSPVGPAGTAYIVSQIAMIGKRIASGDTAIYEVCKNQIGVNYKTAVNIAVMGI